MKLVPGVGVEPTRLSSVDFESTASANSATRATIKARKLGPGVAVSNAIFSRKTFERFPAAVVYPRVSYPFFLENS